MSDATKSSSWAVRPGFAFSAGVGVGAGLYAFDFLNKTDNTIYGMGFAGLGLAGGPGSGGVSALKDVIMKLATQLALKGGGAAYGAAKGSGAAVGQQYASRKWTDMKVDMEFSAADLDRAGGRVTILGLSAAHHGAYWCYVSGAPWVSFSTYFHSVSVDVLPQSFDMQIGHIIGMWFMGFSIPNS